MPWAGTQVNLDVKHSQQVLYKRYNRKMKVSAGPECYIMTNLHFKTRGYQKDY